jgi:hypothetical protein
MSYKNLKLAMSDCETMLHSISCGMKGTLSSDQKGNGLTQFSIEIPGTGTILLNVYDTPKGLTINWQVGGHQDISEQIAKKIADCCETVAPKTYTFKSIYESLYNKFTVFINTEYAVSLQSDNDSRIITKVSSGQAELTITWFKTNHTLMFQGRTTPLWDEMILWFADEICTDPLGIIEIVFDTPEKFAKAKITFTDDLLEKRLKEIIKDVYNYSSVLTPYEKKWLKTSLFLLETDISLPEYYPCISSAIKVVEGMLRRVCMTKLGHSSFDRGNFAQFEESPSGGGLRQLKATYKSMLKDPASIDYLERLYNFMRSKRHPYSHNNGVVAAEITSRKAALNIFEELIVLINESGRFTKVLF